MSRFPNEMNRLETYGLDLTGSCDSEYFMQGLILYYGSIHKYCHGNVGDNKNGAYVIKCDISWL